MARIKKKALFIFRYPIHFTFNQNHVDSSSIQVHEDDPVYIVNIKRGIMSSLQMELLAPEEKHKSVSQVNMLINYKTFLEFPFLAHPNTNKTDRNMTEILLEVSLNSNKNSN